MQLLDKFIYLVTIIIFISLYFISTFYKSGIFWIKITKKRNSMFSFMGVLFCIIALIYIIYNLIEHEWYYLLLGDLCAFITIISGPILLLKKHNIIKVLGPFMVLGGLLAMIFGNPGFISYNNYQGTISYLKHVIILSSGLLILGTEGKYKKRDYINSFLFGFLFFIFIILVSGTTYWVTGDPKYAMYSTGILKPAYFKSINIGKNRFIHGEYYYIGKIAPYPLNAIGLILVGGFLIFVIKTVFPAISKYIHNKY